MAWLATWLCLALGQPPCHHSRELNLDGIGVWPSETSDVWLLSDDSSMGGNATVNVTGESFVWKVNLCAMEDLGCGAAHASLLSSTGDCVNSFDSVQTLEEDNGLVFAYASTATSKALTVTVRCAPNLPDGVMYMGTNADGDYTTTATYDGAGDPDAVDSYDMFSLTYSSRQACRLNDKLCTTNTVYCRNRSLSCIGTPGVCTDPTCVYLSKQPNPATDPLGVNVRGELTAMDCTGTTIPGLGTEDFVTEIDDKVILPDDLEGAALISDTGISSNVKLLVALALDQSASVVATNKSAVLKESVVEFLQSLYPDDTLSMKPRTGIFAFDGSEDIVALQPSFSDSKQALVDTTGTLPVEVGDGQSTNLYGAVDKVVRITESVAQSLQETTADGATVVYQRSIVVFSDGADTAGRYSREASVAKARQFTSSNETSIYFIDLSTSASDVTYAASITSSDSYFRVDASDLAEAFSDIGKLLAISASKYSIGVCTPVRDDGFHGMFVSVNYTKLGTLPSNKLYWPFPSANLQPGCTEATLQDAAEAAVEEAQSGSQTSLPILSRSQSAVTVSNYFYVDTTDIVNAAVYADTAAGVQILLTSGSGECGIVTKYCFDANGTTRVALPAASMMGSFNLSGLVTLPNDVPLTTAITLRLQWAPKPVPTPVPTSPVTAAPDTSSSDDSSPNVLVIVLVILGVIVLCLAVFWVARYLINRNKPPLKPAEAEPEPAQQEPVYESELVTFKHFEDSSRAVPVPPNFENMFTASDGYAQPNTESGRGTPLLVQ